MEKYLIPKQLQKKYKTEHSVDTMVTPCCDTTKTSVIVAKDKKERVINEEYSRHKHN